MFKKTFVGSKRYILRKRGGGKGDGKKGDRKGKIKKRKCWEKEIEKTNKEAKRLKSKKKF